MKGNMEVLLKNNSNLVDNNKTEYGCICSSCRSVFIFNDKDIVKPRTINYSKKDCSVKCPVCNRYINIDKCIEFKTNEEKTEFRRYYDVRSK